MIKHSIVLFAVAGLLAAPGALARSGQIADPAIETQPAGEIPVDGSASDERSAQIGPGTDAGAAARESQTQDGSGEDAAPPESPECRDANGCADQ